MDIFTAIYFIAIIVEIAIRAPISKKRQQEKMSEQRVTTQERTLLGFLFLSMFLFPVVYTATNWLDFANYTLPTWAAWLGVLLLAGALFVFWRAHADLGLNWSPSLEIREKHELITRGIYGVIRHPMYASQWLWVIAQPLLMVGVWPMFGCDSQTKRSPYSARIFGVSSVEPSSSTTYSMFG